jgi:hypothetical protein
LHAKHCRAKRIKTNLTKGKEMKTEKSKECFWDHKGPLARRPYGPPGPHKLVTITHETLNHQLLWTLNNNISPTTIFHQQQYFTNTV